jgi:transposase-like protein
MECPTCGSKQLQRNGFRGQVQCYRCKRCGRQFLASYKQFRYSEETKRHCVDLYFQGMSAREIEAELGIHHTTILSWIGRLDGYTSKLLNDYDINSDYR